MAEWGENVHGPENVGVPGGDMVLHSADAGLDGAGEVGGKLKGE